ncbi:hypothetical protein UH38_13340 [Aliterella atlantica CENA595]|uniref:Uncharacterized protein n=1 Tax=Aliterella atlantica CENA595 TaxID=1618023 RepID=A0A0D8ZSE8_9CYAN|nr:hypothetical protein UH38_13340 [Aliterella atlantica CENA595]
MPITLKLAKCDLVLPMMEQIFLANGVQQFHADFIFGWNTYFLVYANVLVSYGAMFSLSNHPSL